MPRKNLVLLAAGMAGVFGVGLGSPANSAESLKLRDDSATYETLSDTTVTLSGKAELHITGSGNPIENTTIDLTSEESWVFFHDTLLPPSHVNANLISQFRVNGGPAILNESVRIVAYGDGTVVIPHRGDFRPLTVFERPNFEAARWRPPQHTLFNSHTSAMGGFYGNIGSFILKRGYMATLATQPDGSGHSEVFIAQDSDLEVSVLPEELEDGVRFLRVVPWRWTKKKGIAGNIGSRLDIGWWYNWNISEESNLDREYVAIRQTRWWPSLTQDWQDRQVSHLLGFNEPDNAIEANLSVAGAIDYWPNMLATGLRLGSPAPTDAGLNWLYRFTDQANSNSYRVDFTVVHYYRCHAPGNPQGAADQMYRFLSAVHERTGKPIWITEWNNGANWTNCGDPSATQQAEAIQAMTQMLEDTPFVERYAPYNWVEDVRRLEWNDASPTAAGIAFRDIPSNIGYRQTVPESGGAAQAHFAFEGHLRDSSGNGNNPLTYGTPMPVADGVSGQALSLDGTDDYLKLPNKLAGSRDFTFAAWVKWAGGEAQQRIFDCGRGTDRFIYLTPSDGSALRFGIKRDGARQELDAAPLNQGEWTHVAVTLEGNVGRLFVDGQVADVETVALDPESLNADACFLGKSQWSNDPLFGGRLDDVVFRDEALSEAEIAELAEGKRDVGLMSR